MTPRLQKGFTLIELLVTTSILSMLSSIVLVSVSSARVIAYDSVRISDMHQIERALELYYADHKQYPPLKGASAIANESMTPEYCDAQTGPKPGWCMLREELAPYINLPVSPNNNGVDVLVIQNGIEFWHQVRYFYRSSVVDGYQTYGIATVLISESNIQKMINDGGAYNEPIEDVLMSMYEVGSLPKYCGSNYSGVDADWWGISDPKLCRGGN